MKKKLYILALTVVMVASLAGCKKDKKDDNISIKDDLIEFVNEELPAIQSTRNEAVSIYNQYFTSEEVNLEQYRNDLEVSALPKITEFISQVEAIEVATDEMTELKGIYIDSAKKQQEAIQNVIEAIKTEDPALLDSAEEAINESTALFAQYESKLRILAVDNGITINGDAKEPSDETPSEEPASEGAEVTE